MKYIRYLLILLFITGVSACNTDNKFTDLTANQLNANSANLVSVSSANPSSGNAILDLKTGLATDLGAGNIRVRMNKNIGSYDYDLYVYINTLNSQISHVSLSWTYNKTTLFNAYSSSPAGVSVDLTTKKITFTNTLLSSGLPSTANLNGQFLYN